MSKKAETIDVQLQNDRSLELLKDTLTTTIAQKIDVNKDIILIEIHAITNGPGKQEYCIEIQSHRPSLLPHIKEVALQTIGKMVDVYSLEEPPIYPGTHDIVSNDQYVSTNSGSQWSDSYEYAEETEEGDYCAIIGLDPYVNFYQVQETIVEFIEIEMPQYEGKIYVYLNSIGNRENKEALMAKYAAEESRHFKEMERSGRQAYMIECFGFHISDLKDIEGLILEGLRDQVGNDFNVIAVDVEGGDYLDESDINDDDIDAYHEALLLNSKPSDMHNEMATNSRISHAEFESNAETQSKNFYSVFHIRMSRTITHGHVGTIILEELKNRFPEECRKTVLTEALQSYGDFDGNNMILCIRNVPIHIFDDVNRIVEKVVTSRGGSISESITDNPALEDK